MHSRSYVTSILFNRLFPHSNMLKYIGSLTTGSYSIEGNSYSASFFAYFSLFIFLWAHFLFVFLRRNFIGDYAFWFVLVRRTDLR